MFKFISIFLLFLIFSCAINKKSEYEVEMKKYRKNYKQEFLTENRSPLKTKKELKYIDFFPVDSNFKVKAEYSMCKYIDTLDFKTSSGKIKQYFPFAVMQFKINNEKFELTTYTSLQLMHDEKYKDYLFIPFNDFTNGEETYGGGRYIDITKSEFKDGFVNLDFNKAYNPWCAFATGYNCPIPPSENYLNTSIKAGEKKYKSIKTPNNH